MNSLDTTSQVRIKHILFATDFSPAADKALPYAAELARRYSSTVYAVHVKQPDIYPLAPPSAWPKLAEEEEEFQRLSKQHLDDALREFPHELILQVGDIWPVLSGLIREKEIDLLVLGTHGRKGFQKAVLGSVAEAIFRQSRCPVLTVGPGVSSKVRNTAELNRILYATDFSTESLAAAPYAISLAREHRAQLVLLHLIERAKDDEVNSLRHTLAELVPLGADLRTEPDCIVERGAPGTKILEVAEGHGADLIVLGVRYPKGSLTPVTHFLRSDAYHIVAGATCPVLTVRG
ncbi:MAG TPA: universal stress protein [Candidatus Acidoferrales bacterium]|nr:universal stress protein [Candidatus Acidoferrales bacterium]